MFNWKTSEKPIHTLELKIFQQDGIDLITFKRPWVSPFWISSTQNNVTPRCYKKHDITIHFLHQQSAFYFPYSLTDLLRPQARLRRKTYLVCICHKKEALLIHPKAHFGILCFDVFQIIVSIIHEIYIILSFITFYFSNQLTVKKKKVVFSKNYRIDTQVTVSLQLFSLTCLAPALIRISIAWLPFQN
jgi:hypothetical protein